MPDRGKLCRWERTNITIVRRRECRAYINQLRRVFGPEPDGASLSVKSNPHDFGSYLSVVCYYHPEVEATADYAFHCERESPKTWDAEALTELKRSLLNK